MTYPSQALATSGLVALWPLNDAAGALVAADLGPNNLPLTYSAGKVDGSELVLNGGSGMASTVSSAVWASRSVAAGSALAPTTGITIAAWLMPTDLINNALIAGRTSHFRTSFNAGGGFGAIGFNDVPLDIRSAALAQINTAYFVVHTYNGKYYRTYINGVRVQEYVKIGTLAATADSFLIGGNAGNRFAGTISHVGVWNRGITAAEVKELWLAGTKVPEVTDYLPVDNLYDDTSAVIASAPTGTRCAGCQGLRRANEPVVTHDFGFFHPACYASRGANKAMSIPSSSSTLPDYEGPTLRVLNLVIESLSKHITSWSRPTYYDGTRMQNATDIRTGGMDVFGPWVLTPAVIARHLNLPKQHWMIKFSIQQMEYIWSYQQADGTILQPSFAWPTPTGVGLDFLTGPLGEAILYLKPYVDSTTYNRWVTNFLAAGDSLYNTKNGTVVPESDYYVNGNREAGELWGIYMMYLVSGRTQKWLDRYEAQYQYTTTLSVKAHEGVGGTTYGFVTVVAPTQADGSDGKGYLIERTGGKDGHIIGPDSPSTLDGYDPNYVSLCSQFLTRLYLHSNDVRILKIINMQYNMLLDRVNTGASAITSTLAAPVAVGDMSFTLNSKPTLIGGYFVVGTGTGAESVSVATVTGTAAPYTAIITSNKAGFTKTHASGELVSRELAPWALDGRGGSRQDNPSSFGVPLTIFLGLKQGYSARVTPTMVAASFAEMLRFEQNDTLQALFINRDVNQVATWIMCLPNWPGDPV
jgi:hypothetical protein